MATEVIHIIDPNMGSGYDYDSLYDWEAGEQGDLTGVRDEIAIAKCRCTGGTADTTSVLIDGWTTSATQYIKIWTDPAETYRHSGVFPTGNKYRLESSSDESYSIRISENYVKIIGLAISITSNAGRTEYLAGISIYTGGGICTISHCVIKGKAAITNSSGISSSSGSVGPIYVYNNIIYDMGTGTGNNGIWLGNSTTNSTAYAYSNTVVNCARGAYTDRYGSQHIKNNLIRSCTTAFGGEWGDAYNNSTDLSTSGIIANNSVNNRTSQTFSFVDENGDNFHLAASDTGALGYGINLYNDASLSFQDDIDGEDRGGNGATWDIGADEYIASGAATALPRRAVDGPFYGSLRGSVR